MSSVLNLDRKYLIYIPHGADKGDCPFCQEGVLGRESQVERTFRVAEGYRCDLCGRAFIETIYLVQREPWQKNVAGRRYFMEATSSNKRSTDRVFFNSVY